MVYGYREGLSKALGEVASLEGPLVLRTPKGVAWLIQAVLGECRGAVAGRACMHARTHAPSQL